MIVAARQRIEIRDHAGGGKKFDPVDRRVSRRDQMQRRKPVLGDDAAERGHAAGQIGEPAERTARSKCRGSRCSPEAKSDEHDPRIVSQRARKL